LPVPRPAQADPRFDGVLALDLEWVEPGNRIASRRRGSGRAAVMQLATPARVALFQTAAMDFQLPPALREVLRDPGHAVLVQGWAGSDERVMQRSFGFSGARGAAARRGAARPRGSQRMAAPAAQPRWSPR
jgi:hypothetical protein